MRLMEWSGIWDKTARRLSSGSRPFNLADPISLN
jgi:hypothetical protein